MMQDIVVNLHPYPFGGTRSLVSLARSRGRFEPTEMEIAKRQRLAFPCKPRSRITQPMFARRRRVTTTDLANNPSASREKTSPRLSAIVY
jgi:hypothetical protein